MKEIESIPPHVRRLGEMREVLYDQGFAALADPVLPVYQVYRDVPFSRLNCSSSLTELRYDVTLIPPVSLGLECPRTYGHYHSAGPRGATYAEIYEVLQGTLHLLIQRTEKDTVAEVRLIEGHPGDKVVVPPSYGHVLINPSDVLLATGNLISGRCVADYELWRRRRGGAYYELKKGEFVKNPNYGNVPEMKPEPCRSRFPKNLRLTELLSRNRDDFRFLVDPLSYEQN